MNSVADTPAIMTVGSTQLTRAEMLDHDSRGLIWMYEPPRSNAHYVLGADPSVGITGWDRTLRSKDDVKADNAAVEVIRKGSPDVQVAEYAAPIDAYELAKVINFLGRMYCGANEDGQALACIEMNIGWATQTELINKYGYMNLPPWRKEGGLTPHITPQFGWYSNRSNRRDLWIKGMRHINMRAIQLNSAPLIEEMTDCTWDNFLSMSTARAIYGSHDDRVVALLIAVWYAHEWSLEWAPTETAPAQESNLPDYQASGMTAEEMSEEFDERVASHWQW